VMCVVWGNLPRARGGLFLETSFGIAMASLGLARPCKLLRSLLGKGEGLLS
jgi:hypothetical protein